MICAPQKAPHPSTRLPLFRSGDAREHTTAVIWHEEKHQTQVVAARKLFMDGPLLVFSISNHFNYTFDSNALLALDDNSTLYRGDVQVTDQWGVLHASEGVLFVREKSRIVRVQVPAPADATKSPTAGKGWTLDLKPDWRLVPEGRLGDFAVRWQSS